MKSRLSSLILLLHIQGSLTFDNIPVNCAKQNICAVKEDQVTLKCFYSNINIITGFWFSQKQTTNWREKDEPEDLTLDLDYMGRVNQLIANSQSQLTISDLRERDSGEYQLMFIMKDGVKRLSSVTVSLTVTVLQVKITSEPTGQEVKLMCDMSCKVTARYYYWYKSGRYLTYDSFNYIYQSSARNTDSYMCSIYPFIKNPSSSVCLSNSNCWNVSYASRRVCALVGSTVDFNATYSHPTGYTVEKTYWHLKKDFNRIFLDLREEQQFAGRVEYLGNTLRIKDVHLSDSEEYQFRFITDTSEGKFSGSPGVILTVTDTQVISSPDPVIDGEKVILSCSTKCTLDNKHTYIWYKNGQQVTDGFTLLNKLYLDSISRDELQDYSCAIGDSTAPSDTENHAWLRNTAVVLSVFLTLGLIGVLWYRLRRYTLSKNHKETKEAAQEPKYESVYNNDAPSEHTQKKDIDNQDIHYSSIEFSQVKTKNTSSDTTEKEDVEYATVMFI